MTILWNKWFLKNFSVHCTEYPDIGGVMSERYPGSKFSTRFNPMQTSHVDQFAVKTPFNMKIKQEQTRNTCYKTPALITILESHLESVHTNTDCDSLCRIYPNNMIKCKEAKH